VCRLPWSDCCTNVIDRFGVFWYLSVPGHQPDDDELDLN
jgi:PhnB protein